MYRGGVEVAATYHSTMSHRRVRFQGKVLEIQLAGAWLNLDDTCIYIGLGDNRFDQPSSFFQRPRGATAGAIGSNLDVARLVVVNRVYLARSVIDDAKSWFVYLLANPPIYWNEKASIELSTAKKFGRHLRRKRRAKNNCGIDNCGMETNVYKQNPDMYVYIHFPIIAPYFLCPNAPPKKESKRNIYKYLLINARPRQ